MPSRGAGRGPLSRVRCRRGHWQAPQRSSLSEALGWPVRTKLIALSSKGRRPPGRPGEGPEHGTQTAGACCPCFSAVLGVHTGRDWPLALAHTRPGPSGPRQRDAHWQARVARRWPV